MENFPRQVTSYTPKQSCLNSTWLHLTFESLPCLLTIMEQCHGNKCVLGNYSLFTLVTYITEEWGWTTRDLLLTSLKLYDYHWWTRFMLHTVKHDCISPPFYLMTRSIFRAAIKKFSCTQRRPLNDKLKPLFHMSLQSHLPVPTLPGLKLMTELLQLQQAVPGTQQTCPALPASQLSQYLRCSHHPNVTKRPLQPRMGSCLDTGELAQQTRVSACTCQYKCPLRLLAICGADKSTAQRGKGKHSDKLYGLGGDSALTKFKEQVLQCPATETKTR